MTDKEYLDNILCELTEIYDTVRYVELNSIVLNKYLNEHNLTRLEDLSAHFLAEDTQIVFDMIPSDLMENVRELRQQLGKLRDSVAKKLFIDDQNINNNVVDILNKLIEE